MQTLWQNLIGSDIIKDVVSWGTKIVKSLDTVQGKFLGIIKVVAILMAYNKVNPLNWVKDISSALAVFNGQGLKGSLSIIGQYFTSLIGIAPAMKAMTAETMANTLATTLNDDAKTKATLSSLGFTSSTEMLTIAQRKQAIETLIANQSTNGLTNAQISAIAASWGLKTSTDAVTGSVTVLDATTKSFMASNPIGWILAVVSVLVVVVTLLSQIPSKMEQLQEEFQGLKTELSDIQSELKSVNSELETTQDRIAELLAQNSLSFTEKEELENLQKQNDELQRRIDLLESEKKYKQNEASKTFNEIMSDTLGRESDYLSTGEEVDYWILLTETQSGVRFDRADMSEKIDLLIQNYADANQETKAEILEYIKGQLDEFNKNAEGLDYFTGDNLTDDQKQTNEWLDYINNLEDRWAIMLGGTNAKTNAINRIFNKDEFDGASEEIDKLLGQLKTDPGNKTILNNIREQCKLAEDDLYAVGLSAEDAFKYFTMESSEIDSSTLESITQQYAKGIEALTKYKNAGIKRAIVGQFTSDDGTIKDIYWEELFDQSGRKVVDTQISKLLQGADEATRKEFANLVQSVTDGKITLEQAISEFSASGLVKGWQLVEAQVAELNADVFQDLGDDISGVINTVSELSAAFESVANSIDLVNQAQAEMAYSGHLSVETALQLMESTDNWNELLTVEEGNIRLVDNAEQILVQTKLDLIKKNLQTALSTVEAQLAQITATESSADMAYTIEESTNLAVTELAANMAYLTKIMEAYAKIAAGEDVVLEDYMTEANDAKELVKSQTDYKKNAAQAIGRENLEAEKARLEAMLEMYETVDTPSEFENNYFSDNVSGGNKTKEDAETDLIEDGWEKLINKYENRLALITNERDLIEAEIDKAEARGGKASTQYYRDLIRNSNEEKELLQEKYDALEAYLNANENAIDPDTWTEYNNELNEVAVAIKECETNTIEWAEAIREIDIHYFEQTAEAISQLGEELDFVNGLLEDEEVADENGNWSSAALTRIGLYTQQMEKAAAVAKLYQDEIDELNAQYKNGELGDEQYQERLAELVSGQRDAINSYEDAKDGIVELNEARIDAIKDGIEKEIEAYEDLIDAKKEELDAERDLYDFKNNVKKQTKDIATLERRIAALSGSNNASDIAERRRLEAELLEAREGLNDTYYEHSRDQQGQALDEEAEAFSESKEKYIEELEATLDDVETLITSSIMDVMLNADTVFAQLNKIADDYGTDLSKELIQPWNEASARATEWKNELYDSMTSGEYATLIGEDGAITAFANGVAAKLEGSWDSAQAAASGYFDFLTKEELGANFSETITGFGTQIQSLVTYWDNVKAAAEAAHAEQERKVTVGGNPNVGNETGSGNDSGDNGGNGDNGGAKYNANVANLQSLLNEVFGEKLSVDGKYGPSTTEAVKRLQTKIGVASDGKYGQGTSRALESYLKRMAQIAQSNDHPEAADLYKKYYRSVPSSMYAKGTLGTTKDQWAITDEIGDELVLVPGPNGNLSFMRKGTSVIPADITANLVEWGKLSPDMLNITNPTAGVNMISNAVNKPELNITFDSLIKAEHITEETLPAVKKLVTQELNRFTKELNYALKGKGAR